LDNTTKKIPALFLVCATLAGCTSGTGPGAGIRRTSYPSLVSSTTSYRWLVVKCRVGDVSAIPNGLDTNIEQFMGIAGANYGNIVDYFHDVSYNRASVISDTFVGWIPAPFNKADLTGSGRLASAVPGRQQRVQECLGAIPADQAPDLDDFYGVVVVNNDVQDGGACYVGQKSMTVNGKAHNLACIWFDPNSLTTEFAAHEFAHGLGMTHSYDDSGRNCGGVPGEYCDPWDIMSAQGTYQFIDQNWIIGGNSSGGGPGISAPGLLQKAWLPADNQRQFQFEGENEQLFKIRALSHARRGEPLVVIVETGDQRPFEGIYTVEYRQGDGWDLGFATDTNTPAKVRETGGVVMVHQYRPVGAPTSTLVNGAFAGAMQPCDTLVLGNGARYVTVKAFDTADGSATVAIGFGRGKFTPCFRNIITNQVETRGAHAPLPLGVDPSKQPPERGRAR
jgi:hypothetical protein